MPNGTAIDPRTWAGAIKEVGASFAVIFALLAIGAYLALKAVPAVVDLTVAINHNSDVITAHEVVQEKNQEAIITNQGLIISNESAMIAQHGELQELLKEEHPDTLRRGH